MEKKKEDENTPQVVVNVPPQQAQAPVQPVEPQRATEMFQDVPQQVTQGPVSPTPVPMQADQIKISPELLNETQLAQAQKIIDLGADPNKAYKDALAGKLEKPAPTPLPEGFGMKDLSKKQQIAAQKMIDLGSDPTKAMQAVMKLPGLVTPEETIQREVAAKKMTLQDEGLPMGALPTDAAQGQAQKGPTPAESALQDYNTTMLNVQANLAKAGAAGAAQAQAESSFLNTMGRNMEQARIAHEQKKEMLEQDALQAKAAADQAVEEMRGMSVDPNRFYKNASTGQKVGFALSAMLSGFAGDRENTGLALLKQSIDNDIMAQKADIEKAGKVADNKKSLYATALDHFKDANTAFYYTQNQMMKEAEVRLKQIAAQYQGPQIQAKLGMELAKIQQEQVESAAKFQKSFAMSGEMAAADDVYQKITTMVPKEQMGEAIKEYGQYKNLMNAMTQIDKIFDRVNKVSSVGRNVPFVQTQSKTDLDQALAELVPLYKMASGEQVQKSDEDRMRSFLGRTMGSEAELQQRKEDFKEMLKSLAVKNFPMLHGMGIVKNKTFAKKAN